MPPIRLKIETHPSLEQVSLPYRKFREKDLAGFMETLAGILHQNIQDVAPVRTGVGRKSIVARKRKDLEWAILIDRRFRGGKYMTWQHEGVSPSKINPIVPRKKQALWWSGLPHPIAIVRNHPGIKRLGFFETGIEMSRGDLDSARDLIGAEIQRKFEE